MKINKKYFTEYLVLRNQIDSLSKKLETEHQNFMNCKSGCDLCCMDYNIFPIEFYSILNELKSQNFKQEEHSPNKLHENSCIFLKNHKCTIYHSRPFICRTHGLPLLFTNDEGEWELSACELNFTKYNFEEFTLENTFPQDTFNSKLFILNKEFIADFKEKEFNEFDLISLKKLKHNL